jgi:hypothetical protein
MKRLLNRIGQHLLQGVTLAGSIIWLIYLGWVRDPILDWGVILAGFVLAGALGWWPLISLGVAAVLEGLVWLFPGLVDRRQAMEEIAVFWALGLGMGTIARTFLSHHESLLLDETRPIKAVAPTREAGRMIHAQAIQDGTAVPAQVLEPVPVSAVPVFLESPLAQLMPVPMAAPPQPVVAAPREPAYPVPAPSVPAEPPPPKPSISLTAAAPLKTQELDIGDFRAWMAAQQAAGNAPSGSEASGLPSGLMARHPSSAPSSQTADSHSSVAGSAVDAAPIQETDPRSPNALLLEWYNQFTGWPLGEDFLQRRYPGGAWLEQASADVRAMLDLWRSGADSLPPSQHFDFEDVQSFFRCELLFLLRRQGVADLHALSPLPPVLDWLPDYQAARRSARGHEAVVRSLAPEASGFDPSRGIAGRPDALLEVADQSEVVTVLRPISIHESSSGLGALGAFQLAVSASLGVPLSGGLVLVLLPALGDRRAQPRILVVDDQITEFRRLDGALERMRRILEGSIAPKPQVRSGVCDTCGRRHSCASYAGLRPRLNLSEPPALFARLLP